MALKYEVADINEIDESQRDFYEEKDGKYVLSVEGIPEPDTGNIDGLKNKANELLSEKKKEQEKRKELEQRLAELERKPTEKGDEKKIDDILAQLEDAKNKLAEKDNVINEMNQSRTKEKLRSMAREEAGKLTKDASRLELLAEKIESRLYYEDGNLTVLDENGKPTISPVADLSKSIAQKYPFLVDGKGASGGGASGNSGSASGAVPKLSELSDSDLVKLKRDDPDAYNRVINENK